MNSGIATISGTYTCMNGAYFQVLVSARQNVGRFSIVGSGYFFDFGTCDGAPHAGAADVFPENGKFGGGKTMTVTFAQTCGSFECASGFVEQTVQLRSGRK